MNPDDELLHRCADGVASPDEYAALAARLRDDAELRGKYLDLMNLDSALAAVADLADAGADATPKPVRSGWLRPYAAMAAGLALGVLFATATWASVVALRREPEPAPVPVIDGDFEKLGPHKIGGFPKAPGWWRGDATESVGAIADVRPHSGAGMLQFLKSDGRSDTAARGFDASDLWQLVDLTAARESVDEDHQVLVEAEAWFNSAATSQEERSAFQLTLYAIRATGRAELNAISSVWLWQSSAVLAFGSRRIQGDTDAATWERVAVTLPLPEETKYLLIHMTAGSRTVSAASSQRFPGQFADSVSVKLRPQPPEQRFTFPQ